MWVNCHFLAFNIFFVTHCSLIYCCSYISLPFIDLPTTFHSPSVIASEAIAFSHPVIARPCFCIIWPWQSHSIEEVWVPSTKLYPKHLKVINCDYFGHKRKQHGLARTSRGGCHCERSNRLSFFCLHVFLSLRGRLLSYMAAAILFLIFFFCRCQQINQFYSIMSLRGSDHGNRLFPSSHCEVMLLHYMAVAIAFLFLSFYLWKKHYMVI